MEECLCLYIIHVVNYVCITPTPINKSSKNVKALVGLHIMHRTIWNGVRAWLNMYHHVM